LTLASIRTRSFIPRGQSPRPALKPSALTIRDNSWLQASQEALLQGDWKTALAVLPPHHQASNDPHLLKHLCCVYLQAARWEQVVSISAPAAQRFSHEAIFWECWAWAEHTQGETVRALRILEFASNHFPNREGVAYSLACLYAATQQLPKARKWLARAKKLSRDLPSFISKVSTQRELKILWTAHEHAFAT
jgi:hypothetical protein